MTQPNILTVPFGNSADSGSINPIPVDPSGLPQSASWEKGFPPITMLSLALGGRPPRGQDFNGILKAISEHIVFMCGGGAYKFRDEWLLQNGGYPLGAILINDSEDKLYISKIDNNIINFNTATPEEIADSWGVLAFEGVDLVIASLQQGIAQLNDSVEDIFEVLDTITGSSVNSVGGYTGDVTTEQVNTITRARTQARILAFMG